jgi:hypothetical protein
LIVFVPMATQKARTHRSPEYTSICSLGLGSI